MRWNDEADKAMARVPFFVRKRVRQRVEEEAKNRGAQVVTMAHVHACQQRFMHNQEAEVKGYQIESCFGGTGCPNRIAIDTDLAAALEQELASRRLKEFLKTRVGGPLKLHHEFRITLADCPNSCSRPQIVDVGLIAARHPGLTDALCSGCGSCAAACREGAISLTLRAETPVIDFARCLACGQCIAACPTGTLDAAATGYRILIGGKLGRHPQLGQELPGIHSPEATLAIVRQCVDHFMAQTTKGERFGEIINRTGLDFLAPITDPGRA
ncbi:MAG: 4Fe-4S binding protein [Thermodesulfobacteriota bacterium]